MIWEGILDRNDGDLFALVELVKWHEHRAHDCGKALMFVFRAQRLLPAPAPPAQRESLRRRIECLEGRLAKAGQG